MPILMRDRWVHIRLSRGSEYCKLGHLDRQAGFVRLCPAGEDVEDHLGAVEHLDAERLLEIADLGRREIVVEDDNVGVRGAGKLVRARRALPLPR